MNAEEFLKNKGIEPDDVKEVTNRGGYQNFDFKWINITELLEEYKGENLPVSDVNVCFTVVNEMDIVESIHLTKEAAQKEIDDWNKYKPSWGVRIEEREIN